MEFLVLNVNGLTVTPFLQDRVTDHRLSLTITGLEAVLDGRGLPEFLSAAQKKHATEVLDGILEGEDNVD